MTPMLYRNVVNELRIYVQNIPEERSSNYHNHMHCITEDNHEIDYWRIQ
jgi:hypothetical protein